jgi:STE24 endopeptidase
MNVFTLIFVVVIVLNVGLQLWLSQRHIRYVAAHRDRVPDAFKARIPLSAHQKAAHYTITRTTFAQYELLIGTVLLLIWTLGGGLNLLDTAWRQLQLPGLITGVAVMLSVYAIVAVLDLPLSAYRTFVVEQRFGFNRTTPRTFVMDVLKRSVLLLIIGTPLAALVLWLMNNAGDRWWLYVWIAWMIFSLVMTWAYPVFIAPLFNRFRPLDDEDLRNRIEALLTRSGFSSKGIFVMDGSLRSTHGNAYFTGFGTHKRIVFFDTLLKELEHKEIESVLAHELGHFKRNHIIKKIVLMASLSLLGLALLGWLIELPWFYHGLGVSQASVHIALILFLMVAPVFSVFLQPILAALSRKYEFEADDYAAQHSDPVSMIGALVKLYKENAATLTPDPLYSAFHDSHPPAPVRVAQLLARTR